VLADLRNPAAKLRMTDRFGGRFVRVRMGRSGLRNLVEGIGNGADEVFDAGAGGGRNGVEWEVVFFREGAKFVDACEVGSGVELGSDDDHGFRGQGSAEGPELARNDFE